MTDRDTDVRTNRFLEFDAIRLRQTKPNRGSSVDVHFRKLAFFGFAVNPHYLIS
jgi:hypothetical protein